MSIKTNQVNRAQRNRTIILDEIEIARLRKKLLRIEQPVSVLDIVNKTIHQDTFQALDFLPDNFVDLVFADPPYNLNKAFNLTTFRAMESEKYEEWLDSWVKKIIRLLKPNSLYIYLR